MPVAYFAQALSMFLYDDVLVKYSKTVNSYPVLYWPIDALSSPSTEELHGLPCQVFSGWSNRGTLTERKGSVQLTS